MVDWAVFVRAPLAHILQTGGVCGVRYKDFDQLRVQRSYQRSRALPLPDESQMHVPAWRDWALCKPDDCQCGKHQACRPPKRTSC